MEDWPKKVYLSAIGCLVLALVLLLLFAFVPLFEGDYGPVASVAPILAMLLIVLAGMLSVVGMVLYIYEIATAKNEGNWRAIWIIVIFFLGILGIVIYELVGRKEIKR